MIILKGFSKVLEYTVDGRYELVKLVKLIVLDTDPHLGKAFGDDKVLGDDDSGGVSKGSLMAHWVFSIRSDR